MKKLEEDGIELPQNKGYFAIADRKFTQAAASKSSSIKKFVKEFLDVDIPILLTYPSPETGWNVSHLNGGNILFQGKKFYRELNQEYIEKYLPLKNNDLKEIPGVSDLEYGVGQPKICWYRFSKNLFFKNLISTN